MALRSTAHRQTVGRGPDGVNTVQSRNYLPERMVATATLRGHKIRAEAEARVSGS